MCKTAYEAESAIVDWIFEKGEVDFLPKNQIKEFIKIDLIDHYRALELKKYLKQIQIY